MAEEVERTDAAIWLNEFIKEIDCTDPMMISPSSPVAENESVLVVVEDEFLRKIMSLGMYHQREKDRNRLEANYGTPEERRDLLHRATLCFYKSNACFQLFWGYVIDSMDLVGRAKFLGIREGWQIVEVKIERKPGFMDFFLDFPQE